ncbi:MAG: AMP-binding protein [Candidatus Saccharibacteria bacterium]|nr:AMP-binding protein [Candidatus Saccharibacteria bacterium]
MEAAFASRYGELQREHIRFSGISNDAVAVISYTSGTTGFSKGVMIPHNSLAANVRYAQKHMPLESGDPLVSFLPLAHTYGCAFEFLFPFTTYGCTILPSSPRHLHHKLYSLLSGRLNPGLFYQCPWS